MRRLIPTMPVFILAVLADVRTNIALAQDDPKHNPQFSRNEEVIVTARRQRESAEKVPMAISSLSGTDVERDRITQISDLSQIVPSFTSYNFNSDANGFAANQDRLRGLSGTVVYFDDVPVGGTDFDPVTSTSHGTSAGLFYDLQDVEVLKGPQGTLFGKNSIGGLISLEPQKPSNSLEGYFRAGLGNYFNRQLDGAVNFPIVQDKVLLRIAGQSQQRDGYTKDASTGKDYDNRNEDSWRVTLLLKPSEDFRSSFLYNGYYQHTNGSATILSYVNPAFRFGEISLGALGTLPLTLGEGPSVAGLQSSDPLATIEAALKARSFSLFPTIDAALAEQLKLGVREVLGRSTPGLGKDDFFNLINDSNWDVNDRMTLRNIASVQIIQQLSSVDYTNTPLPILNIGDPRNNTGWSESSIHYTDELQLQGYLDSNRLSWIIGNFLEIDRPLGDTNEPSTQLGTTNYYHFYNSARSEALFAHGIYDLQEIMPGLHISAGYRYTWDYVSTQERGYKSVDNTIIGPDGSVTNCAPEGPVSGACGVSAASYFSSPGWNLSLDQQLSRDAMVYIRSGHAYRPGANNPQSPVEYQSVQPERVTDVEVGGKFDLQIPQGHFRVDADIFHTSYRSIQVPQDIAVPSTNHSSNVPTVVQVETNNGDGILQGAEMEATLGIGDSFTIAPHASLLQARYTRYPGSQTGQPAPPFLYLPRWQFDVSANYKISPGGPRGTIVFAVDYSAVGRENVAQNDTEIYSVMPGHDNLNFSLDWTSVLGKPLDITLYLSNAFNKTYVEAAAPLYQVVGFTSLVYNEPRMFGALLKYHFDH